MSPTAVPIKNFFPEVLEYRPPREIIVKKSKCFIHNLSEHLLLTIFESYLCDDGGDDYRTDHVKHKPTLTSNLSSSASPTTLLGVCKRWRNSCGSCPALWCSLAIYKPRTAQFSMIQWWLQFTKSTEDLLLSLYLHAPPNDQGHDQLAIKWVLKTFFSDQCSWRMKSLTIKLVGEFPLTISTFNAPSLEFVELDLGDSRYSSRIWNFFSRRSSIQKVSWRPRVISLQVLPFFLIPWDWVTHLKLPIHNQHFDLNSLMVSIICCSSLIDLEIDLVLPPPDEGQRFPILPLDPRMKVGDVRRLREIRRIWDDDMSYFAHVSHEPQFFEWSNLVNREKKHRDNALRGIVYLPVLRRLRIQVHGHDATPILERFMLPELRSLEIIHDGIYPDSCIPSLEQRVKKDIPPSSANGIVALLGLSGSLLTSLYIFDPYMPAYETVRIFVYPDTLKNLCELELCVPVVNNSVIDALTIEPNWVHMPKLRKLVLPECNVTKGRLVDMVASRLNYSVLRELRLCFPRTKKRNIDRDFNSKGWTMSKRDFDELNSLKNLASAFGLKEGQFTLTVD